MTWVRIDDQFPDHPKVIAAGPLASWLYVCGLAYSNRYLTDGFIPERQATRLVDAEDMKPLVRRLVETGLWESVEGGYQIHDYLDYQPSAEKVKTERAAAAERQAKWRERNAVSNDDSNGVTNEGSNALVTPTPNPNPNPNPNPSHSRPTPVPTPKSPAEENTSPRSRAADATGYPDWFEEIWLHYPLKVGKAEAYKALKRRKIDTPLREKIIAAIECQKQSHDWTKDGGEFIPHMATWVRREGWNDELRQARASPSSNGQRSDYFLAVAKGEIQP